MRTLIIESCEKRMIANTVTSIVHVKNSLILHDYLGCDFVSHESEVAKALEGNYDKIICAYSSPYMKYNKYLEILQKKIEFQRKELVNANRHTRIEMDNRDMTLVLNLLERVKEDYYGLECMDYWDNDMTFNDVPDKPGSKLIDFEEKWEKCDEYLLK